MDVLDSLLLSLLTPMVLAFILGVIASLVKSDLKIPPEIYTAMTIYLLFAIGLKGGANLDGVTFAEFWRPLTAALFLSLTIPVWCYFLMKKFGRLDAVNSAALAFLQFADVPYEPYVAALLAVMDVPAIILAIFLVGKSTIAAGGGDMKKSSTSCSPANRSSCSWAAWPSACSPENRAPNKSPRSSAIRSAAC